jgi:hypothetical protein
MLYIYIENESEVGSQLKKTESNFTLSQMTGPVSTRVSSDLTFYKFQALKVNFLYDIIRWIFILKDGTQKKNTTSLFDPKNTKKTLQR